MLKVIKSDENAKIPKYETNGSAGADLSSVESKVIPARGKAVINTGLRFQIPEGYEIQIRSRSGLSAKYGIHVLNSPGTIDSDYQNDIKIILANHSDNDFQVSVGDRIAQMVIAPVIQATFEEIKEFEKETDRGLGGFGSTGIN